MHRLFFRVTKPFRLSYEHRLLSIFFSLLGSHACALAESLDDNGKMLYLTLEKAPQLTGSGPWMGVVQGEKQVNSDYPEESKASMRC